ncbi:(2Fe-2S)-binding protein [Phormidium pseudopriestleyi FRX01]|uniref:(2Fe-2S)-binding protein n=1 Tax=Phormidium pseudopriestleyi FRX01 TaxID=1759528 RepID=A0ABS3FLK3_9CYAN|nr:2Fe-2S iron-sulfur cluster-binding protein [Phormidium pseudopriestleyi]MBO0347980.1 (2Fe-2S)-binding protein [Phormidium pseudopriestleyi FRX01]
MKLCFVRFTGTNYPPIALPQHDKLANYLTVQNSPILFGCRTGICGTCLCQIEGNIPPPNIEEGEVLEILAPGNPQARLACQVDVTNDIAIAPFEA